MCCHGREQDCKAIGLSTCSIAARITVDTVDEFITGSLLTDQAQQAAGAAQNGLCRHNITDTNKAAAVAQSKLAVCCGYIYLQAKAAFEGKGAVIRELRGMQKC